MPTVQIKIDGADRTDDVLFGTARFMSAVNGVAGDARLRLRDLTSSLSVVPGLTLELLVDGEPVWTGWVSQAVRVYVFPAIDVDDFGPTRFFDIIGADLNLLFSRRIVFDQAHPANILAPLYGTFTSDVHAISDLLSGWLDLSGDALDTSTDVHHVGAINEDQQARAWEGSDTWGQAMQSITALPASIYYIRPNRVFAYVDTDTPDAPFGLSDVPDGVTSKGYREMEVLFDGTNLANDVLAWGVGYGSNAPVFTRAQDATSESTHGRWQLGQTTFGVYRQATVNRIADSILNGSPDHHRGAKDDRKAVTVTTYEPGLLPAQKVAFESAVFGYSEVLPIRKMEITFPTPTTPKYELTLSQEIDVPWSFFDPWRIGLNLTRRKPPVPSLPTPGGCVCGITDTFTRTESNGFGISDSTAPWVTPTIGAGYPIDGYAPAFSVNGSAGVLDATAVDPGVEYLSQVLEGSFALPATITMHLVGTNVTLPAVFAFGLNIFPNDSIFSIHGAFLELFSNPNNSGSGSNDLGIQVNVDPLSTGGDAIQPGAAGCLANFSGQPFTVKMEITATSVSAKYWFDTDPEPGSYQVTISGTPPATLSRTNFFYNGDQGGTVVMDSIDITGLDKCTEFRFDNFNRVVAPDGAGSSDFPVFPWSTSGTASDSTISVNGSALSMAWVAVSSATLAIAMVEEGAWQQNAAWEMTARIFTPGFPASGNYAIQFRLGGGRGTCELQMGSSSHVGDPLNIGTTPFTFFGLAFYRIRWQFTYDGPEKIKVWKETDPEPASWTIETANNGSGPRPGSAIEFAVRNIILTSSETTELLVDWIDFDYTGKPCFAGGSPPGSGLPLFGPVCENATRVDSTHYQLSLSVVSGTQMVYEGSPGALLLPDTDYTINDSTGLITFVATVADGTRIYVCYTANGPLA